MMSVPMLIERLEALVATSANVTLGTDTTTDVEALMTQTNSIWAELGAHAVEMLPVVDRLLASLAAALASAPDAARVARAQYGEAQRDGRFEYPEMPREVLGFVTLDALQRIRAFCATKR